MDPIKLSMQNLDARSIDYTSAAIATRNYYAAALADDPWLYWRLNDASSPGVDYGVAAPAPTDHQPTAYQVGSGLTLHQAGLLTPDNPSTNGGNYSSVWGAATPGDLTAWAYLSGLGHGSTDFTVEYLLQRNASRMTDTFHCNIKRTGFGGSVYIMRNGCNGYLFNVYGALYAAPTVNITWGTGHELDDNAVHQVTWVWALSGGYGYDITLYLDANSLGTQHGDYLQQISFDTVSVGDYTEAPGQYNWYGPMQEFRIYQSLLTQHQIQTHWANV